MEEKLPKPLRLQGISFGNCRELILIILALPNEVPDMVVSKAASL